MPGAGLLGNIWSSRWEIADGCIDARPFAVCIHDNVPLHLPSTHHGTRPPDRHSQKHRDLERERVLQPGRPILGENLRHKFRPWCRHWDSNGISVRDELGPVFPVCRRGHRPDAGDGGNICLLSGIRISRPFSLRREAAGEMGPLVCRFPGVPGIVGFRILHHRNRCVDAAPGGLHRGRRRLGPRERFLESPAEPLGRLAVRAQHGGRCGYGLIRHGGIGRLLSACAQVPGFGETFPARGRCQRPSIQRGSALPYRRSAGKDGRLQPAGDAGRDGIPVQE